jgi:diguanylate cyclase (GGDEF)-like protein
VQPEVGEALAAAGLDSALIIPLTFGNRVLGTVNLLFREPPAWTAVEMDTFRGIGQAVSLALTNARHVAGLEHQAFHDPLTGLPNRAAFHRELGVTLAAAGGAGKLGVVLIDLRRFREINDALGHHVGDRLLVALAGRLSRRIGNGGSRIFRLGGDEFAVLAPGLADEGEGLERARQLLAVLALPCEVDGMSLEVEAAAGVALHPQHGVDSHELLRCADVALYRAKRTESAVSVYRPEHDEHTAERLALAGELGRAVREGGLELHFQPKVALADGRVIGFEALVRWRHPRLGLLLPGGFLPIAEASDLIHPLTYWVVEQALIQLDRWRRGHPALDDATMAVNLSVRNLLDGQCAARIEEILQRVGVEAGRLELELTETAVMSDPEAAVTMLGRITGTGARLAIDDFGTGYSSLAYLRRFPVHVLKIDRSFVADLDAGQRSHAIVRSTLFLARSLGLSAVAEGVEDRTTAERLRDLGCDVAQGDHFARPAHAAELEARLAATGWRLPVA